MKNKFGFWLLRLIIWYADFMYSFEESAEIYAEMEKEYHEKNPYYPYPYCDMQ